jgi:hypothetical protein
VRKSDPAEVVGERFEERLAEYVTRALGVSAEVSKRSPPSCASAL